jgi:hypothetical protein
MTAATRCCLLSQAHTIAVLLFLASRTTLLALLSAALLALLCAMATSSMRIGIHGDYVADTVVTKEHGFLLHKVSHHRTLSNLHAWTPIVHEISLLNFMIGEPHRIRT